MWLRSVTGCPSKIYCDLGWAGGEGYSEGPVAIGKKLRMGMRYRFRALTSLTVCSGISQSEAKATLSL